MTKKNEKWITVMGKHLLVSGNSNKGGKGGKKSTPTAKFDEVHKIKSGKKK